MNKSIRQNSEQLANHQKAFDQEIRPKVQDMQHKIEKLGRDVKKNKTDAQDDCTRLNQDLSGKIDELEKMIENDRDMNNNRFVDQRQTS